MSSISPISRPRVWEISMGGLFWSRRASTSRCRLPTNVPFGDVWRSAVVAVGRCAGIGQVSARAAVVAVGFPAARVGGGSGVTRLEHRIEME